MPDLWYKRDTKVEKFDVFGSVAGHKFEFQMSRQVENLFSQSLKRQTKIAADDILIFFLLSFEEKKA